MSSPVRLPLLPSASPLQLLYCDSVSPLGSAFHFCLSSDLLPQLAKLNFSSSCFVHPVPRLPTPWLPSTPRFLSSVTHLFFFVSFAALKYLLSVCRRAFIRFTNCVLRCDAYSCARSTCTYMQVGLREASKCNTSGTFQGSGEIRAELRGAFFLY